MSTTLCKQSRQVILSVDHEIFGNGTGDVRQHAVEPTERMARLAEKHGVRLVIFFEVEEYLAFERSAGELRRDLGYDPAALMREQARDLVRRGHDIQLHLHPQWVEARYERGRWLLRMDKLTVDALFEGQAEVDRYIAERTSALRRIVGDCRASRICAYRAGGFAAQPGVRLLRALARNGYLFESSVVPGLHLKRRFYSLDYRDAPAGRRAWRISRDVAEEDPTGPLLELPIHAVARRRVHQLTWSRLRAKFSQHVPMDRQMEMVHELDLRWNPLTLARFLVQPVPLKLDFHNVSPLKLLRWIRSAPHDQARDELNAVVLIGHSKEHVHDTAFEQLVAALSREDRTEVTTFAALATELRHTNGIRERNERSHSFLRAVTPRAQ